MRTAMVLSLALAAGWPLAAFGAQPAAKAPAGNPYTAISQVADTYAGLQAVQVVESFPTGVQTTIVLRPNSNRMRFASTLGRLDAVSLAYARNPAGNAWQDPHTEYTAIQDLGHDTVLGVPAESYRLQTAGGDSETIWVDQNHRPVQAIVRPAQGGTITLLFGDYDSQPLIAMLH